MLYIKWLSIRSTGVGRRDEPERKERQEVDEPQNVLPRVNHSRLVAIANIEGLAERRTPTIPPYRRPVDPVHMVSKGILQVQELAEEKLKGMSAQNRDSKGSNLGPRYSFSEKFWLLLKVQAYRKGQR